MKNETKIKIPKKYQERISYLIKKNKLYECGCSSDYGTADGQIVFSAKTQKELLDQISDLVDYSKGTGIENFDVPKAKAWVDGSFDASKGSWGYGVFLAFNTGERFALWGGKPDENGGRQIEGSITAVLKAVEIAIDHGCCEIQINYDYNGVEMWAKHKWEAKKSYTQRYVKQMDSFKKEIEISFNHIKAGTDNKYNEYACNLANKGTSGGDKCEILKK